MANDNPTDWAPTLKHLRIAVARLIHNFAIHANVSQVGAATEIAGLALDMKKALLAEEREQEIANRDESEAEEGPLP